VYVVILGSPACPHCRAQKSFFEHEMPGKAYFCDVDRKDSACMKAFSLLFNAGVTSCVPTMVLCDNVTGAVRAIVVGELESLNAWNKLFKSTPNSTIPMYIELKDEYRVEGYLKPKAGADSLQQLYQLLCVETLRDSSRVG
jgi:glutaredoxin